MPWPRLSVILMFCDSWLFMLSSGILVFGVGLEYSKAVCTTAIYLCIFFYSTSKFFLYAFLAEKVHIVWSPTVGGRRFESPVYLICLVSVSLYCIVITLMLGGPIHETASNGACVTGLKPLASIPLLVYDVYISMFLTFLFLYPLLRSQMMSSTVRRLSIRTLIAAVIALTTSTINVVMIIVFKGRELGWVNLTACGADIIVNATAVFWVSGSKHGRQQQQHISSSGLPPERGRGRQLDHFSVGAVESLHFATSTKSAIDSPQADVESPPPLPVPAFREPPQNFSPHVSYPYFRRELEHNLGTPPTRVQRQNSWFRRMLTGEAMSDAPAVRITVTREFDHQRSQIGLQAKGDSKSDIQEDKSSSCNPS
ncbi:hypothetical protein NLJ89_g7273 [Agrocybe chaxingu]|uniref:Transmembrane protein n=1 Tax=Agrocybe chaxingu TaxID=84603 RepID=A0A9W8JZE6_9AGAR|nr:hypothetical protein NLJ89_g7273 [Agrocybe chaxingu]